MDLPVLNGVIDRRILINYKVLPEVVKKLLPPHLEPIVVNGSASAGICLLRLKGIGLKHSPSCLRITSENAAHRFLVKYQEGGKEVHGVYIPRRDTDSMVNVLLAGKLFSWPHYPAKFHVNETGGNFDIEIDSGDGSGDLHVEAGLADHFPKKSMFDSLDHASSCFRECPTGVSPSTSPNRFKTIHLVTKSWDVKPLQIRALHSSYFEDKALFPEGSIEFDNALLMQGIEHEWHTKSN